MSKGRNKHRKPQPGSASAPTQSAATISAPPPAAPVATRSSLAHRIGLQLAAILGLSAALGFTFNAANPIGVRFGNAKAIAAPAKGVPTNSTLPSIASTAFSEPQPTTPQAAPQPTPQPIQLPTQPQLSQLPTTTETQTQSPAVAQPSVQSATNSGPLTVALAQTNLNPGPIHWREAKPVVASGQALLVDVRPAPVYDAGHIPDAISLPETSSVEVINALLKQLPTNLTLITYCSSTSCSQSKRVADRLVANHKWPTVKYMTGGYLEYQQQELARSQPQQ